MFDLKDITKRLSLSAIFALITILGLGSCADDNALIDENDNDDQMVNITFTINTGNSSDTRAIRYGKDSGTDEENYINLDNLHVYIYSKGTGYANGYDSSFKQELTITKKYRIGSTGYYVVYCTTPLKDLNFSIDGAFRVMVIANWPTTQTNTGLQNGLMLCISSEGVFSYPYSSTTEPFVPSESNTIPMFGATSFESNSFDPNRLNFDLGTISMIRAMSKVVVRCSSSTDLYNLRLTYATDHGMCAPFELLETSTNPKIANMNIPKEQTPGNLGNLGYPTNLPFKAIVDSEGNKVVDSDGKYEYVIYVPEYRNQTYESRSITHETQIAFEDKENKTYTLQFKDYDDANASTYGLLRNTIYIYDVALSSKIKVKYEVLDWSTYTSPDITFN